MGGLYTFWPPVRVFNSCSHTSSLGRFSVFFSSFTWYHSFLISLLKSLILFFLTPQCGCSWGLFVSLQMSFSSVTRARSPSLGSWWSPSCSCVHPWLHCRWCFGSGYRCPRLLAWRTQACLLETAKWYRNKILFCLTPVLMGTYTPFWSKPLCHPQNPRSS